MLAHAIRDIEWRCADYTFSLGIVCTQSTTLLLIEDVLPGDQNKREFVKIISFSRTKVT